MWIRKVPLFFAFLWDSLEYANPSSATCTSSKIDKVVEDLATSISYRLRHSVVLGHFSKFEIYKSYDAFYEAGTYLLDKAGYYDPDLCKVVADAAEKVGTITSELFFDALGCTIAKIWFGHGAADIDNVEPLALSFVNAVEVAACIEDLVDTKSVIHAVIDGNLNIFKVYKYTDYDDLVYICSIFLR